MTGLERQYVNLSLVILALLVSFLISSLMTQAWAVGSYPAIAGAESYSSQLLPPPSGFVTVGLLDSILGTFFYPILLIVGFFNPFLAVGIFISDFGFTAVVTTVGARKQRMVRRMLSFIPYLLVLRITNTHFYMKYLVVTGMLGRSIGKYVKGH